LVQTFNENRGQLFSRLYGMLGNFEDTNDALQAGFLRCWQARENVPGLHNVRAWVWRVSLNAGKDLRDLVWRRRAKPLSLVEATAAARRCSPAEDVSRHEERERLDAALEHLHPEEREVFLLRQGSDMTYEEIARMHGSPVGTAKSRMRKAVHKLRRVLRDKTAVE
jgi:RNA polymerase sigma-70 factor (ECF subfamily)